MLHRGDVTERTLLGVGIAALMLVACAWIVGVLSGTPVLIVFAAALPACLYAAAIIWMQRGDGRPPALLLGSVVWGAVAAAFLSHTVNELARAWMALLAGPDDARAVTTTLLAPAIEEAAKAAGLVLLLVWRRHRLGIRDGIVYGALIGVGFVLTENLIYFAFATLLGGPSGLARSVYLRGLLAGADHAVFTATIGAGIGWATAASSRRARTVAPLAAWFAALGLHIAWNAIASDAITRALCGAEIAGGPCLPTPAMRDLFAVAPALVLCFLAPAGVVLARLYAGAARPQQIGLMDSAQSGSSEQPL
jgi:protease PrsW